MILLVVWLLLWACLIKERRYSDVFQNGSFSLSCRKHRAFFSEIFWRDLVELLEVNLTISWVISMAVPSWSKNISVVHTETPGTYQFQFRFFFPGTGSHGGFCLWISALVGGDSCLSLSFFLSYLWLFREKLQLFTNDCGVLVIVHGISPGTIWRRVDGNSFTIQLRACRGTSSWLFILSIDIPGLLCLLFSYRFKKNCFYSSCSSFCFLLRWSGNFQPIYIQIFTWTFAALFKQ